MTALLIATRNAHKAREIRQVLAADYQYWTLNDFPGAPAAVEDGATFAANASKKIAALADWLAAEESRPFSPSPPHSCGGEGRFYVVADDSGLEVDALDGAPGVHSARFAALDSGLADNSPDRANNAKLLLLLDGVPPARRTARFRCILAARRLFPPSAAETVLFEGVCEGRIALQPAGGGGFGYDPLFIPEGCVQSFAELGEAVKNSLSHRARALEKLRRYLAR